MKLILGISLVLVFLGNSIIFLSYAQAEILPPLKQNWIPSEINNIQCIHYFQVIGKRSDGSPACVSSFVFSKLISRGWGYDPIYTWAFDGLNDTYKVGKPIIFGVKTQQFGDWCVFPNVQVKQDNKTVWTSNIVYSCPIILRSQFHYFESTWKFEPKSFLPELILNQTGKYTVEILNPNVSIQKNIKVVS